MTYSSLNLFTEIHKADFKSLLKGRSFAVFYGQLIFERDGEIFITTIDDARNDFTIEDYQALPENAPFELINGKLVYMPSPTDAHQNISMNLSGHLFFHVRKNKLGQVRTAPLDVHLSKDNVLQPDILFISNSRSNIIGKFIKGAPDFVVEIISPGSKKMDKGEKFENYGKFGVLEYWLIDPLKESVEVFLNENDKLVSQNVFSKKDIISSKTVKDFSIEVAVIFEVV